MNNIDNQPTLEQRIRALEVMYLHSLNIAPEHAHCWQLGTTIQRGLLHDGETGWCVGVGMLNRPKLFFTGKTLPEAFVAAEDHFAFNKAAQFAQYVG